jgi:hypothetical protein
MNNSMLPSRPQRDLLARGQSVSHLSLIIGLTLAAVKPCCYAADADNGQAIFTVCGPKAAQRVLQWYGQEQRLEYIVRECQWPELSKGASVDRLSCFLREQGVHTRVISLNGACIPSWSEPIIAFIPGSNGSLGHFVTIERQAGSQHTTIWDPDTDTTKPFTRWHQRAFKGEVFILTSRLPITMQASHIPLRRPYSNALLCAVGLIIGSVLGLVINGVWRLCRREAPVRRKAFWFNPLALGKEWLCCDHSLP